MSYCILRLQKIKTKTSMNNSYAHNYRCYNVTNANPEKSNQNEELIALNKGEDYFDAYKRKIKESPAYAGTRPRKDAVMGIEVLLTYNSRTVKEGFDEERSKAENVKWLQKTFGKDNVVSAVLHVDESTPHIHAMVIPMVNGRLNARHFTGGKKALSDMQTSYGDCMAALGLERGLKYSKAVHTDIKRFYAAIDAVMDDELPRIRRGESAKEYRDRANQFFIDKNLQKLGEINAKDRQIVEQKTELATCKSALEKLQKKEELMNRAQRQANRFEEILRGLQRGYFPTQAENEAFKVQMQQISAWERDMEACESKQ